MGQRWVSGAGALRDNADILLAKLEAAVSLLLIPVSLAG